MVDVTVDPWFAMASVCGLPPKPWRVADRSK
jgi:hypothetical protein